MNSVPILPLRGARPPREGGMTLLEVTVTLLVLTVIALGVALLVVPVARQSRVNQEILTANMEARKLLEEIQATPFEHLVADYPHGSTRSVPDLSDGRLVVSYEDAEADPLLITLQLEWRSGDLGSMQRTFHTLRTE